MTRLLIANDCIDLACEDQRNFSQTMALWSSLILWHIENNDIIILPCQPDAGYLEYITELLNVDYHSLEIIIAPPGLSADLSPDRLLNSALINKLKKILQTSSLTNILPIKIDATVSQLAKLLDKEKCLPGAAFASQHGSLLANSKVAFRAIAAGLNVPIPTGYVLNNSQEAKIRIAEMLLTQRIPVIIKKDFGRGCRGNEILSSEQNISANGGRQNFTLTNQTAINHYIDENWDWLSDQGKYGVVIEHYYPESTAIFAEFQLSDQGITFSGVGEMLAAPLADGQIMPPVGLSPISIANIITNGYKLSTALHTIGYRGMVSADAIVTPDGKVLFSEYNGRITGSTHIYATLGKRILGEHWAEHHILLERRGWIAPSFQTAVEWLKDSNLAYNNEKKSGVILSSISSPTCHSIGYTIVAENLAAAKELEQKLLAISPRSNKIRT